MTTKTKTTWRAYEVEGELSTADKNRLPESVFAFPRQRKHPLEGGCVVVAQRLRRRFTYRAEDRRTQVDRCQIALNE